MITKEKIKTLEVGELIIDTTTDKAYIQRVRNYCQQLKDDDHEYSVRTSQYEVTVTRIPTITPRGLSAQLRAMKSGEVIHPISASKIGFVTATVNHVGGGFKVRTVVEIEKL